MEYRLSMDAELDLLDIYDHGESRWGIRRAIEFQLAIGRRFEQLALYPYSGTDTAYQIWPAMRRAEIHPYIIFYLPRTYGVFIARILPARMAINAAAIRPAISAAD